MLQKDRKQLKNKDRQAEQAEYYSRPDRDLALSFIRTWFGLCINHSCLTRQLLFLPKIRVAWANPAWQGEDHLSNPLPLRLFRFAFTSCGFRFK